MATHPQSTPDTSTLVSLLAGQKVQTRKFMLTTVFVALLAAAFALGLAWRQGVFERHLVFSFTTASGQNLSRGMPVLFKGFKIGYLDSLDLQADGHITGEVIVKEKHAAFLTLGSGLRLSKDKIVTTELLLEPGPPGAAPLPSGAELPMRNEGGIDALEKRILDRVDPVLAELTQLMKRLGDPQHGLPATVEAMRVSLVQANTTLKQVHETLATADKTFGSLDARIKDPKLDSILSHADQTLAGLRANTEQLNKTLESSRQLMGTGQQLMGTGNQALLDMNRELAETLKATRRTLDETTALMDDMRGSTLGHWLVGPRKAASAPAKAP